MAIRGSRRPGGVASSMKLRHFGRIGKQEGMREGIGRTDETELSGIHVSEFLALKHESMILGHSFSPVHVVFP